MKMLIENCINSEVNKKENKLMKNENGTICFNY